MTKRLEECQSWEVSPLEIRGPVERQLVLLLAVKNALSSPGRVRGREGGVLQTKRTGGLKGKSRFLHLPFFKIFFILNMF